MCHERKRTNLDETSMYIGRCLETLTENKSVLLSSRIGINIGWSDEPIGHKTCCSFIITYGPMNVCVCVLINTQKITSVVFFATNSNFPNNTHTLSTQL